MVELKKYPIPHIGWTYSLTITLLVVASSYFFLLPPSYLSPEYIKLYNQCGTCQEAQKLAVRNFARHNYQIFKWGLPDQDSPSFKIADDLKAEFGIVTLRGGCVSLSSLVCYNRKMRQLLVGRYGSIFR